MGLCVSVKNKKKTDNDVRTIMTGDSEHALLDRFGSGQIEMLRSKFKEYERHGGLDLGGFKKIMPYISKLPGDIIDNAFNIFRNSSKDRIPWTNFCATVSQYILGTRQEKCRFLYDVFDKKHRGMLNKDEVLLLNKHLIEVLRVPVTSNTNYQNLLEKFLKPESVLKFSDFHDWAIVNIDLHKALQPFEIIPSAVTEKEIYLKYHQDMKSRGYTPGELYFIISKNWMQAWRNYVRFNSEEEVYDDAAQNIRNRSTSYKSGARPIEISNLAIIDPLCNVRLLPNLRENNEFEILCKGAWNDFHKWYGGGPEIARVAVKDGEITYVDIYPPVLKIFYKKSNSSSLSKDPMLYLVNMANTVGFVIDELKQRVKEQGDYNLSLSLPENKVLVLEPEKLFSSYKDKLAEISVCSFELSSDNKEHSAILEETLRFNLEDAVEYLENGYWMSGIIRQISATEYTIGASWHKRTIKLDRDDISKLRKPPMMLLSTKSIPFSTGLANIGNTCYMNSILQSFAHSPLINWYFTGESYADIKRRHGLHPKWKIVEEVENLLNELRASRELKIRPDRFYVEVTKVHQEFQGFEQHDSHEFLGILLNSLHEDLKFSSSNVSQTITLKGVSNEEERNVSQQQWEQYRGMYGSVISAICGGQTRNCLTCKNCNDKNTIFEVFTDFSIPIPIKEYDFSIGIIVVPRFSVAIQKIVVNYNKEDSIESFLTEIENKINIKSQKLIFGLVKTGFIAELFQPISIEEIQQQEKYTLYIFEILSNIEEVEALGKTTIKRKKPSDWREKLSIDDQIDIFFKNQWQVGRVLDLKKTKILVQVQDSSAETVLHSYDSDEIAYYRQKTTNSNTIFTLPMVHGVPYRNTCKYFGTPQVLTIGSWYCLKDLLSLLLSACELFVQKRVTVKKKVSFFMYKRSGRCVFCRSHGCRTCKIPRSYANLEDLVEISDDVYILACWTDEFYYKDVFVEEPDCIEVCTVHDCFTKYTEVEVIEKKCEACGSSSHECQVEIWRLPDILIIHLKRFSFKNAKLLKINHLVKFPLVGLDMSFWMLNSKKKLGVTMKTTRENYLYDLYSVVNHTGGISGGHYTSFCKLDDGKWLYFDDDRVFQVTGDIEEEVVTKKAYILFYKRQRFRSGNILKTMSLAR